MKSLLLGATICLCATAAMAQTQPPLVQLPSGTAGVYGRPMTSTDLKGFFGGKADVASGTLTTPTITGGTLTTPTITTPTITTPAVTGGTVSGSALSTVAVSASTFDSGSITNSQVQGYVKLVANNAALKAAPVSSATIRRLGFASAGDGGNALYTYTTAACTLNGGAGDNGSQVQPTGGTGCWIADFVGTQPSPKIWGAAADNATDDTAALQAAANAMAGGTLYLGQKSYYIASNLTIPSAETIRGPIANIGVVVNQLNGNGSGYANVPALTLASGATIYTGNSATIDGVLIYRHGMTFPAADSSLFAGTAITVAGDNPTLKNSMVMGFNQAITSTSFSRGLLSDVNFDNNSNIYINNANDTWRAFHIHAWPFSVQTPTLATNNPANNRSGTNFYQTGSSDASQISDYLSFGYMTAFSWVNNSASVCNLCDADNNGAQTGSVGFNVSGSAANSRTTLINPQSYSNTTGISVNTTGGLGSVVKTIGGTIAGNTNGFLVVAGSNGVLQLGNVDITNNQLAMEIDSPSETVDLASGNHLETNFQSVPIHVPTASQNIFLGHDNVFGDAVVDAGMTPITATVTVPVLTIASSAISLPPVGSVFTISAGGSAGALNGCWAGRMVTLAFLGVTTIFNGSTPGLGTMNLHAATNYTSAANGTLTLVCTNPSSGWMEVARN